MVVCAGDTAWLCDEMSVLSSGILGFNPQFKERKGEFGARCHKSSSLGAEAGESPKVLIYSLVYRASFSLVRAI